MPQHELTIRDYLQIIKKKKQFIMLFIFLSVSGSAYYNYHMPIIYKATATVKIEERKTIAGLLTEWIVYSPGDIMQSEANIIRGFPIMGKTALRMGMINENSTIDEINRAIMELRGCVSTEIIKQTNIIEITATSNDAKRAANLANTVAEVYVEENLLEKNKQARTVRQFIEEQLSGIENRLRENEERIKDYGEKVKNIRIAEAVQKKMTELEFEKVTLLQKYTEEHPQVKQVEDQIKQLEEQFGGFSDEELEYARLAREVEINKKLYANLKEKLEEARITEAQKIGDISIVNPAVLPIFPISSKGLINILIGAFMGLVLGIIFAFLAETMDTSLYTVDDIESFIKLPILGVIPAIKTETQKPEFFITRLIHGFFPFKKHQKKGDELYLRLIVHYEPKSAVAEAYRSIRTNIKSGKLLKTILITSATQEEGKTTFLTNLGLALAQTGAKTLLVSSDLRRPAIAKSFGMKEEPGLSEVITKSISLDEVIKDVSDIMLGNIGLSRVLELPGIENIHILPSGRITPNPVEILASGNIQGVIDELKAKYDIILFDSPPLLPLADASLIAPKMDGVIIIYEAGKAPRSTLLRAKTQLESSGAKILGIILNHINPQTEAPESYPYYYQYKYYRYYREKPEKEKAKLAKKEQNVTIKQ